MWAAPERLCEAAMCAGSCGYQPRWRVAAVVAPCLVNLSDPPCLIWTRPSVLPTFGRLLVVLPLHCTIHITDLVGEVRGCAVRYLRGARITEQEHNSGAVNSTLACRGCVLSNARIAFPDECMLYGTVVGGLAKEDREDSVRCRLENG